MTRSLTDTMPATQIGATSLAQLAVVAAAMVSDLTVPRVLVIGLHLALAGVGAVTLRRRFTPAPFMVLLYALLTVDLAVARTVDEPIVTVACTIAACTTPMTIMLYRGWWPVPVSIMVTPAMLGALVLWRPDVDPTLITAIATTNVTLLICAIALMDTIRRFADRADRFEAQASAERQQAVHAWTAREMATENARTLHDTVINTLGALGRGAPPLLAPELVRERCRQDAERVDAILASDGARPEASWRVEPRLLGAFEVRRSGLDDDQLTRYQALTPPAVARALRGCVDEAIQNASKHSGADHVDVNSRVTNGELVIDIADAGVGFDGRTIPRRGLAESVFARARENGIRAELHTAPGRGTRITLGYRLDTPDRSVPETRPAAGGEIVDATHRRTCWTWAATLIMAGIVSETINRRGQVTWAHLMLVVVAVLSAAAWWVCRNGRRLPRWLTVIIVLGAPTTCALAYQAVDFGWDHAFLLQTAALTPLFAILLVLADSRRPLSIALALMIAAIAVPAAFHSGPGVRPLVLVVVMSIPLFALLASWFLFYRGLDVIGRRFALAWDQSQRARRDRVVQEAADATRRRWNAAGLESSVALLRAIADGDLDPGDGDVRQRCRDEESYLREISSLLPDQSPMSWWLALALAEGRSRSVRVHLRVRTVRPEKPHEAEAFGRLALACVTSAPAGSGLVISLFSHHDASRLFVVGDHGLLPDGPPPGSEGCRIHLQTLGGQTILEAQWEEPTPGDSQRGGNPTAVERLAGAPVPSLRPRRGGGAGVALGAPLRRLSWSGRAGACSQRGVPMREVRRRAGGMPVWATLVGVLLLVSSLLSGCGSSGSAAGESVVRVPADVPTISAAVDKVAENGLILVSPGTYRESVTVTKPGITIRGTDRNTVIIDGENKRSVGILVSVDGVTVQNLTARGNTFYGVLVTGEPAGGTGRGGYDKLDPEKSPPVQRFLVDHVTAVNNGLYGIYAFDSQHGVIQDSYASGSSDSGFYVGQCRNCNILVRRNVAERNAVGFENANASDSVYVIANRFSGNRVGLTLLSDYQEAFVPQHGNTVAGNLISDNTSGDSPAQADGGFGIGIGISGGQDNTLTHNRIGGNPRAGVLITNATDIPATGNHVTDNELTDNGVDVADASTASTPSSGNCVNPTSGLSVLPQALATASCPGGTARGAGADPADLPTVAAPAGVPFTRVSAPKAQPAGDGSDTVPDPLPDTIDAPDLSTVTVPAADYLAEMTGTA